MSGSSNKRIYGAPDDIAPIPCKGDYSSEATQERLQFVRGRTEEDISKLALHHLSSEDMKGHVENFLGAVQIPVGLAGPLLFQGHDVQGPIYAPCATTEGALVASICRGSKLLTAAGGVKTKVISQTIHRAPSFVCRNVNQACHLRDFILANQAALEQILTKVSKHTKLLSINPVLNGRTLHCIFHYSTGDAAGQNMVTVASEVLMKWILDEAPKQVDVDIISHQVEGGMNGDKKVNFLSMIHGRGVRAVAECLIPDSVFQECFKIPSQTFYQHYVRGASASTMIGLVGLNVNIANVIAAIFVATGQDIASVHESSVGFLNVEPDGSDLYCSLTLPSLLIGTVGGGTGLPAQSEALKIMDCCGAGKRNRLAEIMAGFCLALDISTWSAIAQHTFTGAHVKLGRK
jgi:NADP-dependent 3-hydroxy-3-methylglutaryl-CoA reductase